MLKPWQRRKARLHRLLLQHTYCRLQPSLIHGVGVFAVKTIPRGVNPFLGLPLNRERWYRFSPEELRDVNFDIRKMIHDFCAQENGKFWIPEFGLNGIAISTFLNHSKTPNMKEMGECADYFVTLRTIRVGEELTVDYESYDDKGL